MSTPKGKAANFLTCAALLGASIGLCFSSFGIFSITWQLHYSFYGLLGIWELLVENHCFKVRNDPQEVN